MLRAPIHTPAMTLKNAALLALIAMILLTALRVGKLISDILNAVRGLVPAVSERISGVPFFRAMRD
jgi:hypothetical protein